MYKEKTYYKLCKRSRDGSNISFNTPDRFQLEYTLNKVTRPISGSIGILVFASMEHVSGFIPSFVANVQANRTVASQILSLLECKVRGPVIRTEVLASYVHLVMSGYESEVLHHWIYDRKFPRAQRLAILRQDTTAYINNQTCPAPRGTFSVGAVMPIREVTQISWKN